MQDLKSHPNLRQVPVNDISNAPIIEAPFAEVLVEIGRARSELVVLSADLSKYTDVLPFSEAFPERFFQVGMAEQNMMGIAGGLAKTGLIPVAVTYSVFAARRACDQVQMALATGHNTAIIMGFLPGITTPFRASHQGTDDLAIMRSIPGMTIIDPMDATELTQAFRSAIEIPGPVYIRGLRGQVAQVIIPPYEFQIGPPVLLCDGEDIGFVSTGLGTQWALEATNILEAEGVSVGLLHVPTIKPFAYQDVAQFAEGYEHVITIENHSIIGGLGSAVAEATALSGISTRLHPRGVPDRWAEAGTLEYLRMTLGLDSATIVKLAKTLVGGK